jgi:hypothetical protein
MSKTDADAIAQGSTFRFCETRRGRPGSGRRALVACPAGTEKILTNQVASGKAMTMTIMVRMGVPSATAYATLSNRRSA